jgi:uncharacterized protein YggE
MKRTLIFIAAVLLSSAVALAAPPATISVNGTGSVTMMPDQALVHASVTTTADSADGAQDQNNRIYASIVGALTKLGIARTDVQLSYYNVNFVPKPVPPATPQSYERYGYTVSRSFSVKVRKMDEAGSVVDAVTRAGATGIGGVSFTAAHPERARAQAMQQAVAAARAEADALAKAAGLHVIRIVSMTSSGSPVVPLPMMKVALAASAPTEFDPGHVSVTVDVSMVFAASP